MAIVSFSKDTVIEYVPEYGDNRTSDNPCVIRLKFISFGAVREQLRVLSLKTKGAATQEKSMAIAQALQQAQFSSHIESVKGYTVDGVEVTDAEQFYLSAPAALIAEVFEAMQDSAKLSEAQAKNSERASGGVR